MSYNSRSGHGYGNQKRSSTFKAKGKLVHKDKVVNGLAIHKGYREVVENGVVIGYLDTEGCFVRTEDTTGLTRANWDA